MQQNSRSFLRMLLLFCFVSLVVINFICHLFYFVNCDGDSLCDLYLSNVILLECLSLFSFCNRFKQLNFLVILLTLYLNCATNRWQFRRYGEYSCIDGARSRELEPVPGDIYSNDNGH